MLGKRLKAIYEGFLAGLALAGLIPPLDDGVNVASLNHYGVRVDFGAYMKGLSEIQTKAIRDMFAVVLGEAEEFRLGVESSSQVVYAYLDSLRLGQELLVSTFEFKIQEVLTEMANVKTTLDGIVTDLSSLADEVALAKAAALAAGVSAMAAEVAADSALTAANAAESKAAEALAEAQKIDDNVGNYP